MALGSYFWMSDAMNGSVYFGTINLSQSFHQVPINDPKDRDKTAFIIRKGQFRFTAMPMGSVNSTSVFSRLMSRMLAGSNWVSCLCYVDDTVIIGRTFDEACSNTEAVLDRFRQANLKLKPTKTKLFQLRVKFLGHVVSKHGIEMDFDKVSCSLAHATFF